MKRLISEKLLQKQKQNRDIRIIWIIRIIKAFNYPEQL